MPVGAGGRRRRRAACASASPHEGAAAEKQSVLLLGVVTHADLVDAALLRLLVGCHLGPPGALGGAPSASERANA